MRKKKNHLSQSNIKVLRRPKQYEKPTDKKEEQKKEKKIEGDGGQISFLNQLSLLDMEKSEEETE